MINIKSRSKMEKVFEPGGVTADGIDMISSNDYEDDKEPVLQTGPDNLVETQNHHKEPEGGDTYYGEINDTFSAIQRSTEERDDTASTYSSDVPLLEPSKPAEEPFAEKLDFVADKMRYCDSDKDTEIQTKIIDQDFEGAFINPSAETNITPSCRPSLSLETEKGLESNFHSITPRSPKKLIPSLGKFDSVTQQPLILSDIDYVEAHEVTSTPLHVIGAYWEFGSLSSVHNLHRELSAFRSRTNTIDQQSYTESRRDIHGGSNRLLARVFSNAIGSVELGKGDIKEPSLTWLPNNASLINEVIHEEKRLCCNNNTKNLLVVSAAVTLMFTSMFGLTNLQSSMNSEGGLGVYSIAMSYTAFLLGSLFSTVIVKRYKPKICLVFGCLSPLFYVLVHFHPTFAFFLPASFILGLSKAVLWNAVSTYITEIGIDESGRKGKSADNVIGRYYGIFFLLLQLAFVFGNLISSLVLVPQPSKVFDMILTFNQTNITTGSNMVYDRNISDLDETANTTSLCGSGYCNSFDTKGSQTNIDDLRKTILLGLYSLCIIASTIIAVLFLDQLPNYTATYISIKDVVYQAKNMLTMFFDGQFLFILVLCMYTIICNGFVVADILTAYVTCPLGIHMVGYTMICFGLTGAASSYMSGKLIRYTGRIAVYVTAMVMNAGCLIWMMAWNPRSEDTEQIFVLLGLWGFAEGIWQSQINSLISSVFADRYEEAFGCCRLVQGVAGIIVFTLSENLCMMSKIIITMTTCILGVALYIVMEITRKLCPRKVETQDAEVTVG